MTGRMKNPPHPARVVRQECIKKGVGSLLRRESDPYDLLARIRRQVEAMGHIAPASDSKPFDTALRAYSGQTADLEEATSEPGIRVAKLSDDQ